MPGTVSLKKIVEEIDLLLNEEWTAYLNRRTGELYTVTTEQVDAVDDPDDPDLEDWQREDLPKVREILGSADWVTLPTKFDLHEYQIMERFCLAHADDRQREQLLHAIAGRGAFRRFKDLVHRWASSTNGTTTATGRSNASSPTGSTRKGSRMKNEQGCAQTVF